MDSKPNKAVPTPWANWKIIFNRACSRAFYIILAPFVTEFRIRIACKSLSSIFSELSANIVILKTFSKTTLRGCFNT